MTATEVWRRVANVLEREGLLEGDFELRGIPVPCRRIAEVLEKRSSVGFDINGGGYSINFGASQLFIHSKRCRDLGQWDAWVEELEKHRELISAFVLDAEYHRWQNTIDPELYKLAGRPFTHLPMKSNGKPPPIDRVIIDTSRNPGRWILHRADQIVEAVGAVMWLGPTFAERTDADLERLRESTWCEVVEMDNGVTRVQVRDACFDSAEGEQGALQNRLRAALFPRNVAAEEGGQL